MAFLPCDCRPDQREAVGVGHSTLAAIASMKEPLDPLRRNRSAISGVGAALTHASAVGVGNQPDAIPDMRGVNGRSRYAMPLRVIPDRGQVSENAAKPKAWPVLGAIKQVCDVLHDEEAGSKLASQSGKLRPKAAALAINSGFLPGARDVLAWEPAADDIDGNSIGSKAACGEGSDVIVAGDLWPVLRQDAAAERFDLAEGDGLEPARALQPEAEAANPREEVQHVEHHVSALPLAADDDGQQVGGENADQGDELERGHLGGLPRPDQGKAGCVLPKESNDVRWR
jgi:hypothetical protein